jgi:hypothetical protein
MVRKASTSFLKKRSKKLLFLGGLHVAGQVPYLEAGAGRKSLLVLFFRKEHAFL